MLENNWISTGASDIGTVRKINEDNYLDAPQVGMWCVADGMGGHEKGDVASSMIIDYLKQLATTDLYPLTVQQIIECINTVNDSLLKMAINMPKSTVIGSTVVTLVFDQNDAHCIWAGDSRIYRLRDNSFKQLTRDHSQVEEMVAAGLISADKAKSHPSSNAITRAVGASEILKLEVASYSLLDKDIYLLCSDGLNKVIADNEIANLLKTCNLDTVPDQLIKMALDRLARDNVTVVVIYNSAAHNGGVPGFDHLDSTLSLDDTLPLRRN